VVDWVIKVEADDVTSRNGDVSDAGELTLHRMSVDVMEPTGLLFCGWRTAHEDVTSPTIRVVQMSEEDYELIQHDIVGEGEGLTMCECALRNECGAEEGAGEFHYNFI
jgi:hypothetical protein